MRRLPTAHLDLVKPNTSRSAAKFPFRFLMSGWRKSFLGSLSSKEGPLAPASSKLAVCIQELNLWDVGDPVELAELAAYLFLKQKDHMQQPLSL